MAVMTVAQITTPQPSAQLPRWCGHWRVLY